MTGAVKSLFGRFVVDDGAHRGDTVVDLVGFGRIQVHGEVRHAVTFVIDPAPAVGQRPLMPLHNGLGVGLLPQHARFTQNGLRSLHHRHRQQCLLEALARFRRKAHGFAGDVLHTAQTDLATGQRGVGLGEIVDEVVTVVDPGIRILAGDGERRRDLRGLLHREHLRFRPVRTGNRRRTGPA